MSTGATAVCVLGMLRTGSSLVAGVLDLLGVNFGPRTSLLAANRANPTGFFEHRGIIALNDELLARYGGTWYEPPELAPGWEQAPALADIRTRARALVESDLAGTPPWGWKDPRTCLTLAFWQALVQPLAYVLCIRRPESSAESLAAMPWACERLDRPYAAGLALWSHYTAQAFELTAAEPRTVVFYDRLVAHPLDEAQRVASQLGLHDVLSQPGVEHAIASFVEPSLQHDHGSTGHPAGESDELAEARMFYERLQREYP